MTHYTATPHLCTQRQDEHPATFADLPPEDDDYVAHLRPGQHRWRFSANGVWAMRRCAVCQRTELWHMGHATAWRAADEVFTPDNVRLWVDSFGWLVPTPALLDNPGQVPDHWT